MAKNTIVEITDDLDGSKNAQEVVFSFRGTDYSIDLSAKNLAAFEKVLKPYLQAATKQPKRAPSRTVKGSSGSRRDHNAIRDWACAQGIDVSDRGRIASSVVDQYEMANKKS